MITAMDVGEYLSYLESLYKGRKLYTNREEGKAKLSSLKSFYDYYFKKNLIGQVRLVRWMYQRLEQEYYPAGSR